MRYKNRQSQRTEVFWFLELEEKLGLIGKITFYVSFALATAERLHPFSSSGVSSLRSCWFCSAKFGTQKEVGRQEAGVRSWQAEGRPQCASICF